MISPIRKIRTVKENKTETVRSQSVKRQAGISDIKERETVLQRMFQSLKNVFVTI